MVFIWLSGWSEIHAFFNGNTDDAGEIVNMGIVSRWSSLDDLGSFDR